LHQHIHAASGGNPRFAVFKAGFKVKKGEDLSSSLKEKK